MSVTRKTPRMDRSLLQSLVLDTVSSRMREAKAVEPLRRSVMAETAPSLDATPAYASGMSL